MHYDEVITRLQNLINVKPTQSDLIKIVDIKQSAMSNRASRNGKFKTEEIEKINNC